MTKMEDNSKEATEKWPKGSIDENTLFHNVELQEKYHAIRAILKEVSELLQVTVVGFEYNAYTPSMPCSAITYLPNLPNLPK